ncbi:hypothetical protein AD16_3458 [Escherichia coli 3-267-03_S4_C2]|nr:hypothetical protein AD16_3458 [Escherichia coli 3-267-03_S4_C2]
MLEEFMKLIDHLVNTFSGYTMAFMQLIWFWLKSNESIGGKFQVVSQFGKVHASFAPS